MKKPHPKSRPGRPRATADASSPDWLTGFHAVQEALRAGRRRLDRLLVRDARDRGDEVRLVELARSAGVPVEWVEDRVLERIAGPDLRTQGVALQVGPIPELSLEALIERSAVASAEPGTGRRLVLLDGVEDPQNVGAIARVAESAGCVGLVLTDRRAPPLTAAVSRASAGAIEWLPVARVTNLVRALESLKAARFWVLAAALEESQSVFALPDRILTGDLAVVLGAEGRGIRPSVLEQADHRVRIPMRGRVESLNVSTAGAVILYELLRRAELAGGTVGGGEAPPDRRDR
ncbi:MAG: 23S rRNA (guanosine(2251)-2'-O)-methyltransferase RlmB [Deltaproteobacteria bacterium]|nr:23S rRNA (guanosine(2251)-2'-O)-methyltransferase RlmB [Deltaproteobacteria bacterium]